MPTCAGLARIPMSIYASLYLLALFVGHCWGRNGSVQQHVAPWCDDGHVHGGAIEQPCLCQDVPLPHVVTLQSNATSPTVGKNLSHHVVQHHWLQSVLVAHHTKNGATHFLAISFGRVLQHLEISHWHQFVLVVDGGPRRIVDAVH